MNATITKSATFDATDYNDDAEAEIHARSYSLTVPGFVAVNVHPMGDSPFVHFLNGAEIWRATPDQYKAMSREGIRLLRLESRR